jgi:hypothetical protein
MLLGAPLPLVNQCPLHELVRLVAGKTKVGVWLRGARRHVPIHLRWGSRCSSVLIGSDLGRLLQWCSWVAVRLHQEPVLLRAEELIRCRALRVVTGTPYLPSAERLAAILPGARPQLRGFSVPTHHHPPEEVLGICLTHGIPVAESRIEYLV